MIKLSDPIGHHDWSSKEYVLQWAERQDKQGDDRRQQFQLLADMLPFDSAASIRFLELGAGYGALSQVLLNHFPKSKAVCHDGSEEMSKLGNRRMIRLSLIHI